MIKFAAGVFMGLVKAFQTDINVFLIGIAALCLAFQRGRGLGIALMFYTLLRRGDDFMSVYASLKSQEISELKQRFAEVNE